MADQGDVRVGFVCVPDEESEEIDQRTSDLLVKAGDVGDFAITGEPTDLHVGVQAKGVLALRIMVFGTSAHGSTPWLGDNAVLKAIDVFRRIESMPFTLESSELFDRPSVNLGRIMGGDAPNKVPEECVMDVDIRYLPEQDPGELLAQIRSLPGRPRRPLLHLAARAGVRPRNPYVLALCESGDAPTDGESMSVGRDGASDAVAFLKAGVPAVEFGPSGGGHHGPDEWVSIASLAQLPPACSWTSLAGFPSASRPLSRRICAPWRAGVARSCRIARPSRGGAYSSVPCLVVVSTISLSATAVASAVLLEVKSVVNEVLGRQGGPDGHRGTGGRPGRRGRPAHVPGPRHRRALRRPAGGRSSRARTRCCSRASTPRPTASR